MAQHRHTRTIHTIIIDLQDDVLAGIDMGDEVEVSLQTREGATRPKRLPYSDVLLLTGNDTRRGKVR